MKISTNLFLILFLFSCSNQAENEVSTQKDPIETEQTDTLSVAYTDFVVQLIGVEHYEEETKKQEDSVSIVADFTSTLNNTLIKLKSINPEIEEIEIFENYRTSLSLINEGPHFDLYEWKGYVSEWEKLNKVETNLYKMDSITDKENAHFPEFTKKELIKYLKDNKEEYWIKVIENPYDGDWKNSYWIGVGLRKLKFKITYKSKKQKLIFLNIYIPMGC